MTTTNRLARLSNSDISTRSNVKAFLISLNEQFKPIYNTVSKYHSQPLTQALRVKHGTRRWNDQRSVTETIIKNGLSNLYENKVTIQAK